MPEIKYYKKEKILSMKLSKNKSVDSDIKGNIVVDYDKNGKVTNIDVMEINLNNFVPIKNIGILNIKMENLSGFQKRRAGNLIGV